MPRDWSEREVRLLVDDYFEMLGCELRNEDYSKTDHREDLLRALPDRTKGAIEFKHQNVSAVLEEMGLPWIEGYKPMPHRKRSESRRTPSDSASSDESSVF